MKVRVRSATGGPTQRVELPEPCDLRTLKRRVAAATGLQVNALRLSLNKRDEVGGPENLVVTSLGLCSGDLLYLLDVQTPTEATESNQGREQAGYASGPSKSLSTAQRLSPSPYGAANHPLTPALTAAKRPSDSHGVSPSEIARQKREQCAQAADRRMVAESGATSLSSESSQTASAPISAHAEAGMNLQSEKLVSPGSSVAAADLQQQASVVNLVASPEVLMTAATEGATTCFGEEREAQKDCEQLPAVLKSVLAAEGVHVRAPYQWLLLAVHAAMLESGLKPVPPAESLGTSSASAFSLPFGWSRPEGAAPLHYHIDSTTVPQGSGQPVATTCLLRCQIIGNFVIIYGAVEGAHAVAAGNNVWRLRLSINTFLSDAARNQPNVEQGGELVLQAVDSNPSVKSGESIGAGNCAVDLYLPAGGRDHVPTVYSNMRLLWVEAKDSLCLPLLAALCQLEGRAPLLSLIGLPAELKDKIMECLPAQALALLASTCQEMRYLGGDDKLWAKLYATEFGAAPAGSCLGGWKVTFAKRWSLRHHNELLIHQQEQDRWHFHNRLGRLARNRPFSFFPGVVGGNYDRLPGLHGGLPRDFSGSFRARTSGIFRAGSEAEGIPHCSL